MLSYAWCFNLHNNSFDIFESDYLPFLRNFFAALCAICKILQRQKHRTNFLIPWRCIFLHIHFDKFRGFSVFSCFIPYIVPNLIHFKGCAALFLYSRNFQKIAVKRQVYSIKSVPYFGQLSEKIAFTAFESEMSVSIGPILCRNTSHRVRRKNYRQLMYRIRMLSLHNPHFT